MDNYWVEMWNGRCWIKYLIYDGFICLNNKKYNSPFISWLKNIYKLIKRPLNMWIFDNYMIIFNIKLNKNDEFGTISKYRGSKWNTIK